MDQQTKKNVSRLNTDGTIELGDRTAQCIEKNNNIFQFPEERITKYKAVISKLRTSNEKAQNAHRLYLEAMEEVKKDQAEAKSEIKSFANAVDSIAKGDAATIIASGFEPTSPVKHKSSVGLIHDIVATVTDVPGQITFKWAPEAGAVSYMARIATEVESEDSWKVLEAITKSNTTVKNLTSGQKIYFVVCAVGSSGQGPWSNPISKIVP